MPEPEETGAHTLDQTWPRLPMAFTGPVPGRREGPALAMEKVVNRPSKVRAIGLPSGFYPGADDLSLAASDPEEDYPWIWGRTSPFLDSDGVYDGLPRYSPCSRSCRWVVHVLLANPGAERSPGHVRQSQA
jgi:hypothetical protein